ncbi:MAG: hypothetical protein ACAI44_19880 [Candidatus Sericytochromatia bacterium]
MESTSFIERCRSCQPELPAAELLAAIDFDADPGNPASDRQASFRAAVCQELNRSLMPADRPLALHLLEQEILSHRAAQWGIEDNLRLAAWLLFRLAQPEDSLLIWRAKSVNFDTHSGLDVQLLAGAGVESTRHFLAASEDPEAAKALEYLELALAAGDLDELAAWRTGFEAYLT